MAVYAQTCTFPGSAPIDATLGWDVVYAVDYDTINADLALRRPWMVPLGGTTPGTFDMTISAGDSLLDAEISQIRFVRGGTGQTVQMTLEIVSGNLDIAGSMTAVADVVANVQCTLAFVANATIKGLHNLTVNTQNLLVTGVTTTTLSPADTIILQTIIQAFVSINSNIFSGIYANVFTKDYAESVNIPWLLPAAFDYAVADKINPASPTDGILAVLGSVSGNVANLTPQVEPLMFPTNPGINAAAALSAQIVENNLFLQQFNAQMSGALADFVYNSSTKSLYNQSAISAFYRIDSTTGQVSLIPPSALATGSGATYPFTIPIGGLTFTVASNAITASINDGVVDLGNGYKQTLQLTTSYQIAADSDQNLDLVIVGSPSITSSVSAPAETSGGDIALELGTTALGIVGGEFIAFGFDRLTGFATSTAMSNATINNLTRNFFAAELQLLDNPTATVTFGIKGFRNVTMGRASADFQQPALKLSDNYTNAYTLRETFPYTQYADNNFAPDAPENSIAQNIATKILSVIGRKPELMDSFKKSLVDAGYTQASNWPRIGTRINFDDQYLDYESKSQLYVGCIKYIIQAVNDGSVTPTLYGNIVTLYPDATMNPAIARTIAGRSLFDGGATGGLAIRTSTGGGTRAVGGLFQDVWAGAGTNRAGVAAALFKDIILNTDRPLAVKIAGGAMYLLGLVPGYFFGQFAGNLGSGKTSAVDTAAEVAAGGPSGPSNLLFSSVTFPFMTRFTSGGVSGPVPASVLQCAAVNGGLILGVAIALNQQ